MPAAAVIPAPIAYIKVVAVKKLVVEFLGRRGGPKGCLSSRPSSPGSAVHSLARLRIGVLYCEKI